MMAAKYRIVRDKYAGFEVQAWRWWLPIWFQVGINTHTTIERAEEWANDRKNNGRVVKVLP